MVLQQMYEGTLINLNESGVRRFFTQGGMLESRTMHLSALANDTVAFESARTRLKGRMKGLWTINSRLVNDYPTT